jgi:hypothetical protein
MLWPCYDEILEEYDYDDGDYTWDHHIEMIVGIKTMVFWEDSIILLNTAWFSYPGCCNHRDWEYVLSSFRPSN